MKDESATSSGKGRRDFLSLAGRTAVGAGVAGIGASALAADKDCGSTVDYSTLKYDDNFWNRDAWARLMSNLDIGKQKFGWFSGTVNGVRDGEAVKPLFGFEGFSFARLVDKGDGVYQKLLREVGFYTDLKTGEVLEHWDNPYTGERVKVVPVANDPFNHEIGPYYPEPPSYGGLNKSKPVKRPLLLNWRETGDNKVFLHSPIHLFYPSALQPEEWPRESAGKMNRVSEMFTYVIDRDDLADPAKTSVEYSGAWSRITPWLPWMLMGQADGHCYYDCMMGGYNDMRVLSPKIKAYAEKHYPKYFEAPTEWVDPSYSSLENYAREQKPAPVKPSGK
ncbi:DUF1838 domain-containing protein [Parahaliea maris]|uniref:DUF1838 domain-containing protein n=1 Tax=Parahaliea maris TaxID=2716870 RepID=A0A5C8ZWR5_9GAMM|nr:DUF1838 family protein [Parahaliea maris]TXS92010.1 DUF1838 domain-containing protein [Parahaliea maris]